MFDTERSIWSVIAGGELWADGLTLAEAEREARDAEWTTGGDVDIVAGSQRIQAPQRLHR